MSARTKHPLELRLIELSEEASRVRNGILVLKEFLSSLRGHSASMNQASMDRAFEEAHWIADKPHQDIDRISDLTERNRSTSMGRTPLIFPPPAGAATLPVLHNPPLGPSFGGGLLFVSVRLTRIAAQVFNQVRELALVRRAGAR